MFLKILSRKYAMIIVIQPLLVIYRFHWCRLRSSLPCLHTQFQITSDTRRNINMEWNIYLTLISCIKHYKLCCHGLNQYWYAEWLLTFWTPKRLEYRTEYDVATLNGRFEKVVSSQFLWFVLIDICCVILFQFHLY